MRKYLFILFSLLLQQFVIAQDIHLSQFYANQQNLNPALSGTYDGAYQLTSSYRNQWGQLGGSPIVTSMLGFNHKFYYKSNEISGGLLLIQDQFSDFGLNTTKILFGGSYEKKWFEHELKVGVQLGLTVKSTDLSRQTFPNQWVRQDGIFDRNISNQEQGLRGSQQFFDINTGLAWSKQFDRYKPTVGVSFFHVNQPTDSYFNNDSEQLSMRTVFHGALLTKLNNSVSLEPKLLFMIASKAQDLLIGGNVYKHLESEVITKIQGGILYRGGFGRNSDALVAIVGLSYKEFDFGLSYDYHVGPLNATGIGTYELSLVYTAPAFEPKQRTLPCDRY